MFIDGYKFNYSEYILHMCVLTSKSKLQSYFADAGFLIIFKQNTKNVSNWNRNTFYQMHLPHQYYYKTGTL